MPEWLTATIVVSWIASGLLGSIVGAQKDAGVYGFFLGIIFGPLGVVAALSLDERPKCPACTGRLNGRARVCPCCHAELAWIYNDAGEACSVQLLHRDPKDEQVARSDREASNLTHDLSGSNMATGESAPSREQPQNAAPLIAMPPALVTAPPSVAKAVSPPPPLPVPPKRAATTPGRNPVPPRRA